MKVNFEIKRFDPAKDKEPHFQTFEVETSPTDRILDCLNKIRWQQDASLSYRMSCAHGVCGSDGMRINGICAIACQKLMKDYEGCDEIVIEPLPNMTVVKDLVVSLDGFFEKYSSVSPFLQPADDAPEKERLQSPEDRKKFDEAIRCILCGCCTASCPITADNPNFVGPAALLRTFRFLFDSRDGADSDRMKTADSKEHAGGCKMHQQCTKVCPKEIPVSKSIGQIKRKIYEDKKK